MFQDYSIENILQIQGPNIKCMMASNYSNGPLEGINCKIKQIKRMAYGYRNWSHFYTQIRIEFTIRIKKRKPIRK
ncbi:transposase [Lactobacillus sp. UCMA15818]|nr:transposase [Lactobacillus sp. UCMA15818]